MPDSPRLPAIPEAAIEAAYEAGIKPCACGCGLPLGASERVRLSLEAAWPGLYAAAREHALNDVERLIPGAARIVGHIRALAADGSREDSHE